VLGIPTQLTVNRHKCSYRDAYARTQALIRDEDQQRENLKWNPEATKGGGTETKERDVECLSGAPERDSKSV